LQKLGKYEILAELGHGAMGVVYKARDPLIGRLVALKTINSNLVDRPDLLDRFYQEAQSAGKLQHPNIVTVFELGQENETPFIAMEYLDGDSLEKTIVRQSDLPLALKVGYIVRICQALEYAHKNRVVHRDIKPGNIMVNSEGVVKVVDFGIARLVDFSRTHTNMMIGTPAYMAPELFRKKKADERTDIWAVGVTFYELVCYQRPFTGDGYDIIRTIMEDEFPSIASIVPESAAEIEPIIQRMLRKQAADRYQSMEDVLLDLEPVWNRLRMSAANSLAARAGELFDLGDLATAYDMLCRARQIDSSNAQVKRLLEKITAEKRRREIQPKVQEHLSRGRNFLQSGQYREAQAEVEAARGLDSRHELVQKLFGEVEAAAARAQQLEQRLRLTKQRLAEGALTEAETALRQAMDIDAGHPHVLELKRQIEEEQARRERRKQLSELLQRARSLWTDLKYDECLVLTSAALELFPNEPELRNLHETAKADQAEQNKQVHISEIRRLLGQRKLAEARKGLEVLAKEQPQDSTVRNLQTLLSQEEQEERRKKRLGEELTNLRSLVSAGKLREAVAKGEGLLKEFPQEYEVHDLVIYARGEVAQQERKKHEQEREKQVRGLLEVHRYPEAEELARRALEEFPKQDVFRILATEAQERWKEQKEKERVQREVQQRIQEIRGKIKRQELTDAIDMARKTLATFGPDTDVTQLLQAAEVEAEEREKRLKEQKHQVEAARTLLEKGDFIGATQVLNQAIATRILQPSDPQAKKLLAQIEEREEARRQEEAGRKREEERKREEKKKEDEDREHREAQKRAKPEAKRTPPSAGEEKPPAGRATSDPRRTSPPPGSAPTLKESAPNLASTTPRPGSSVPVMTPLPTIAPEPTLIQTQIRIEEHAPAAATVAPAPSLLRKPAVLAALGLVLVAVVSVTVYFLISPSPQPPTSATPQELALQKESEDLRKQGRLDEALAKDQELQRVPRGHLTSWAQQDAESIEQLRQQENSLMTEAKAADEKNDYKHAEEIYTQVMRLRGAREAEAKEANDLVILRAAGISRETIAQKAFDRGKLAFNARDYRGAERSFQEALKQGTQNWASRDDVQKYVTRSAKRQAQQSALLEAQNEFSTKQYPAARNKASQVANTPDGDPEFQHEAQTLLKRIQIREDQTTAYEAGKNFEGNGQKGQSRVSYGKAAGYEPPDGDRDLVTKAKEGIARLDATPPPPPVRPKNYDAQLQEVDRYVSEGQWENAQKSLDGVPETLPRYPELQRRISDGRQEDKQFSQKITEVTQAELSNNTDELRHLQAFFATWANKPGRHSAEANNELKQIEVDLKPPVREDVEIKKALDAYAKAYDAGDLAGVRALRQWTSAEEKGFLDSRKYTKGKGFTLIDCNNLKINGDDASISCEETFAKDPSIGRRRYTITLSHRRGAWIIISFH